MGDNVTSLREHGLGAGTDAGALQLSSSVCPLATGETIEERADGSFCLRSPRTGAVRAFASFDDALVWRIEAVLATSELRAKAARAFADAVLRASAASAAGPCSGGVRLEAVFDGIGLRCDSPAWRRHVKVSERRDFFVRSMLSEGTAKPAVREVARLCRECGDVGFPSALRFLSPEIGEVLDEMG